MGKFDFKHKICPFISLIMHDTFYGIIYSFYFFASLLLSLRLSYEAQVCGKIKIMKVSDHYYSQVENLLYFSLRLCGKIKKDQGFVLYLKRCLLLWSNYYFCL